MVFYCVQHWDLTAGWVTAIGMEFRNQEDAEHAYAETTGVKKRLVAVEYEYRRTRELAGGW